MANESNEFVKKNFQQLIDEGVLEIGDGYRAKNDELTGGGEIFLRSGHVTDTDINFEGADYFAPELTGKVAHKMSKIGDTIVTTKGNSTGRTSFVSERMPRFVYSPHLCYWRSVDPTQIENGFIRYWARGREFHTQLAGLKGSTDMAPYLSLTDQRRLKITIPPIQEQRAIASILGALDDKIELNRRMNATLEAMARALFQSWFVDFDPVRAKLDGRQPVGMDSTTATLFPDHLEDSPLGHIPKGWRACTFGDVAKNVSITFDFKRTPEVVFINTGDVLEGDFLHSKQSHHAGLPGQAKKSIRPDDILFSEIRPANRRYAYVDFDSSDYVVSTKFMIIRGSKEIHPRLLYRILTAKETLEEFQVQAESRSGTFPQITFDSISHLPIVLPPIEVQDAFQRAVGKMDAEIKVNKEQSRTLATLRDTLLPKLLSGELSVPSSNTATKEALAT